MAIAQNELGEKLRLAREAKNFTQEFVASKLKITQNAYSRIENGLTRLTYDRYIVLKPLLGLEDPGPGCKKTELLISEIQSTIEVTVTELKMAEAKGFSEWLNENRCIPVGDGVWEYRHSGMAKFAESIRCRFEDLYQFYYLDKANSGASQSHICTTEQQVTPIYG